MNYYLVTTTIRDGNNEYMQQEAVMAINMDVAAIEAREHVTEPMLDDDYREVETTLIEPLTKSEYQVLAKYIN